MQTGAKHKRQITLIISLTGIVWGIIISRPRNGYAMSIPYYHNRQHHTQDFNRILCALKYDSIVKIRIVTPLPSFWEWYANQTPVN